MTALERAYAQWDEQAAALLAAIREDDRLHKDAFAKYSEANRELDGLLAQLERAIRS